jgi:1L-myo-inositol 1-phosphate cytidylyltransferase / CDP-L-myo-inositol myo-inositolphosphotransferase
MEAVIIAAGKGSRMSRLFSPKPLTPLLGLRLIERILLVGKLAGINDFNIVVGYKAAVIKKVIGDGRKYGVRIKYIENPEWEKGNGVSVLKAKNHVTGKFLLLMSDHLFDVQILERLVTAYVKPGQCVLCVDRNLSQDHSNIEDATKVYCEDGYVKQIDKALKNFNAIDTGLFLCTPAIFNALKQSVKNGQYSLSAGNQILAEQGKLVALDITGSFWIDVNDEAALQKAKQSLLQQLCKPTDGLISRHVNRRLSIKISAYLAQYNVSPNLITLASFTLALLSGIFFFFGGYQNIIIGGIMAQLSSILDGCDGEIARLKFRCSDFGKWLDRVLDRYSDGFIILGMTHALWLSTKNEYVWLIGFLALTGTYLNSYTAIIYDDLLNKKIINNAFRIGRDVRLFIIFVGSLFNQVFLVMIILSIITNTESIRRLFILKKFTEFEHRINNEILQILSHSAIPEDYEHALNVLKWVNRLKPDADFPLRIASIGHDIERALPEQKVQRMNFPSYDDFKRAHAENSAKIVNEILSMYPIAQDVIERVHCLIANHEFGKDGDLDLTILKDADSLSFFEIGLPYYFLREGEKETYFRMQWGYDRMSGRAKRYLKNFSNGEDILNDFLHKIQSLST